MGRAPCCDKANVKRGPWSPEEDAKLKSYIEQHGTGGNWIALPQKIGLKRCGKSCRLRWLNYLRPDIKHGGFSEEEDDIICSLYISIGSRWSVIASQLPGRTDNDVKNYWNTKLKKKLSLGGRPRKDLQHGRRRGAAGSPKQEAEVKGSLTVAADDSSWCASHWPQPQVVPTYHLSQDPPASAAGNPSVGQPPISQGGRLISSGSPAQHVSCHSSLDDLIPPACTSADCFKSSPSSPPGGQILQGAGCCSMPELEEIFCCNPVRVLEGLDGFYGVNDMADYISESSRTTTSGILTWEEIMSSFLVCPPLISGYQPMRPPPQQPLLLEEQLHPEMQ